MASEHRCTTFTNRPPAPARTAVLTVVIPLVTALGLVSGCGAAKSTTDGPVPLEERSTAGGPSADPTRSPDAPHPPPGDPSGGSAAAGDQSPTSIPPTPQEDPARTAVDDALARYDAALTAVAADPSALRDPARSAGWPQVVRPGAALIADIEARIMARAADGIVITPPAEGALSWVHRAVEVAQPTADSSGVTISFTWCGWSPGIGRRQADGSVTDAAVAHARGTGTVKDSGYGWQVATLDETELEVLDSGSPDPCPAEVAAAGGGGS